MVGKAALALGLGAGYVLGTRDGRARYEQIKAKANRLWSDPKVQEKAAQARQLAKQKAPQVQERVAGAARKAGRKAKTQGSSEPTPPNGSQPTVASQPTPRPGDLGA